MAATLRELRGRIRSAGSIKKITKAQELIATSRIAKAQARVEAARPYDREITNMLTELASASALDHPLLVERENPKRAAVLVVSSDRGLCGAYNANVLRRSEELFSLLREEGKKPVLYVVGRKASGLLQLPQLGGDRVVDRLLRAAHLRERAGDRRRHWSTPSWPVPTTRATIPERTASSVSTNCTSCSPSSSRCCRRPPTLAGSPRWWWSTWRRGHRSAHAVLVRAGRRDAVRRAAAAVRGDPRLRRAARGGGIGVGVAPARDEVGDRQCRRSDQGT